MTTVNVSIQRREPWNKGKLIGQNTALRLRDIWAIRIHLLLAKKRRALALFDLTINSKLHRQGQIFIIHFLRALATSLWRLRAVRTAAKPANKARRSRESKTRTLQPG